MKKGSVFLFVLYLFCLQSFSQELRSINWNGFKNIKNNDSIISLLDFDNSIYDPAISPNNIYFEKIPIDNKNSELKIIDVKYVNVSNSELGKISKKELSRDLKYEYYVAVQKKQAYLIFYLSPFIKIDNYIQKISEFKIQIIENNIELKSTKTESVNSVLNNGTWYKIGVTESGLQKLDADFLISMGINISEINPQHIRIFGNKSGMLAEALPDLEEDKIETNDLSELAIDVVDNNDDSFDSDDYILFFGQSPDTWIYDGNKFIYKKNIYTDTTYYFMSFDIPETGKRIQSIPHNYILGDEVEPNLVNTYDTYFAHEEENLNLVNTGRQWFGESFAFDFNKEFNTPITSWISDSVLFTAHVAARSSISSLFEIHNGSNFITNIPISLVSSSSNDYYKSTLVEQKFLPQQGLSTDGTISINNDSDILFKYKNNGNSAALAWLDYFTIQGTDDLSVSETSHYLFRDKKSVAMGAFTNFRLSRSSESYSFSVWDVTDPLNVKNQNMLWDGLTATFKTNTSSLKEFLVFSTENDAFSPHPVGPILNQNIHGADQPSYIIVTHPKFINAATRLADYHRNLNEEEVLLVTTEQVYNEFSTGSQDISSIRNMVKLFYDRAENDNEIPKNLLLFGDASFDYKNKLYGLTNYVPTYETYESKSIESSYCTDDYFGVLDNGEGDWDGGENNSINTDLIDIGIGRIPVSNVDDAEAFVDKIINYNSLSSRGEWKNKICFVADDVDVKWELTLVNYADNLAKKVDTLYPHFNINKIYIDSYQQSLSLGSQRYPAAQEDLVNLIEDGVLIVSYVGHAGEVGWAGERILELSDINGFTNMDKLPVFMTAACEFTRYDDATRVSAGEYLLLNNFGGAIGLYSASRAVQGGAVYNLVDALYNYLPSKNPNFTFGETLAKSKNETGFNSAVRKFSFFGDPNLRLAKPNFNVNTLSVELLDSLGQVMSSEESLFLGDTIQALSHVKISGDIIDFSDDEFVSVADTDFVNSFTGTLYMTVFDKPSLYTTLNNDGVLTEPFNYYLQNSIIYDGKVDVVDGLWSFEFIVPKDISYQYGEGKISYYASDSILGEANGVTKDIIVGGISEYSVLDLDGPSIELFMNDTNFVSGGYTNDNPELLALLFDESGINTIGTGIGHDLTAILDGDTWNQYIVNDYYESDLNSFQSGKVTYPFSNLSDGEHTLAFKAWDVYNNSNNVSISFFVTSSSELGIASLFNYPNPSSSFTNFVFEHNRPDDILDLRIDIFSLSGELIKTITSTVLATGFRDESIVWDIDPSVGRGIYVYRLFVTSQNDGSISEKTEKLIIVR